MRKRKHVILLIYINKKSLSKLFNGYQLLKTNKERKSLINNSLRLFLKSY